MFRNNNELVELKAWIVGIKNARSIGGVVWQIGEIIRIASLDIVKAFGEALRWLRR